MTIENLQAHYGFTRMPFGRDLAPQMLHRHTAHGEAVARIGWCVSERALGVITGEVGAGKTVAVRAALAGLDASRTTIIYLANPAVGARGLYAGIVTALGGTPRFHKASLIPQTSELLASRRRAADLRRRPPGASTVVGSRRSLSATSFDYGSEGWGFESLRARTSDSAKGRWPVQTPLESGGRECGDWPDSLLSHACALVSLTDPDRPGTPPSTPTTMPPRGTQT